VDFREIIAHLDEEGHFCSAVWGAVSAADELQIERIAHHTAKVTPGSLFCCLPGDGTMVMILPKKHV